MTIINIKTAKLFYDPNTKTFHGSEKNVRFDTSYELLNPDTGGSAKFNFTHSTGPEFDPKTCWIYKNEEGYLLSIGNDAEITKINAANYLAHKLRN